MVTLDRLTPADLCMPEQFDSFRPVQLEALNFILNGDPSRADGVRRFRCLGLPAGSGKTLIHQCLPALTGEKVVTLTATRSLEDQAVADRFPCINVRGKANYTCNDFSPSDPHRRWTCEEADEEGCRFQATNACRYVAQVDSAKRSNSILTNYQYWMHSRSIGRYALEAPSKAPIRWLVLDECHLAFQQLASYLSVWISQSDLQQFGGDHGIRLYKSAQHHPDRWGWCDVDWQSLAAAVERNARARSDDLLAHNGGNPKLARQDKEYRKCERLITEAGRLAKHANDRTWNRPNWIWRATMSDSGKGGVAFDCVWPHRYAEQYLFHGIPNVVLMSATLRPKLMNLLGIPRDKYEFREWPKQFVRSKAPVYYQPVARMGRKGGEEALDAGIAMLDNWLRVGRLDRKTLVQTASYDRARAVQAKSEFGRYMILNRGAAEASESAEKFRKADAPAILVSPSYGTGWDFKGAHCEFNVILKVPFSDRSQPITIARGIDPEFEMYTVVQNVAQQSARGNRFDGDVCETVILDASWGRVQAMGREFMPGWFKSQKIDRIPPAPVRIAA